MAVTLEHNNAEGFIGAMRAQGRKANRLINEKSPYLLKHAFNPVDWYPWGKEAFDRARALDRPVMLSVGYAACHWCNVMEEESFDNPAVAAVINRSFVAVKVDREERPDVDALYMEATQAMTGGGGWPMTVFLTPDGVPFYAGTYFPPEPRWGRPGFVQLLESIAAAWRTDRAGLLAQGERVLSHLRRQGGATREIQADDAAAKAAAELAASFDHEFGGFGSAPKFPRPVALDFLLLHGRLHQDRRYTAMVTATLEAMARSAIHDVLAGGFHRYSVDRAWQVPHFEKMLYDQAQLAATLVDLFRITGRRSFVDLAHETLDFIRRDLALADGGLASSLDADGPRAPGEKAREGGTYLWRAAEIHQVLAGKPLQLVTALYGIQEAGNVEHDPGGELAGENVLHRHTTLEAAATAAGIPPADAPAVLAQALRRLAEARRHRPRPYLDDKEITAWNAMAASAFFASHGASGRQTDLEAGRRLVHHLVATAWQREEGRLWRSQRKGETGAPAQLLDWACFANALLDDFLAGGPAERLEEALAAAGSIKRLFAAEQGYYETLPGLVLRTRSDFEGAEPAGATVAARFFRRLAAVTGREEWRQEATAIVNERLRAVGDRPAAMPGLLREAVLLARPPVTVIIVGEERQVEQATRVFRRDYLPGVTVLPAPEDRRTLLARWRPEIEAMTAPAGKAAIYLCQGPTCLEPETDPEAVRQRLTP